jgi:hypothetical protein
MAARGIATTVANQQQEQTTDQNNDMRIPRSLRRGLLATLKRLCRRKPDFIIGREDDPYLLRWWVIPKNKWFNIYFHHFLRSDDDRALHDHPWWSISVILKGGYIEHTPEGTHYRKEGHAGWRPATAAHRVELYWEGTKDNPVNKTVWTLFITGPKIRDWGFHCPRGWKPWQEFTEPTNSGQVGKGCDD